MGLPPFGFPHPTSEPPKRFHAVRQDAAQHSREAHYDDRAMKRVLLLGMAILGASCGGGPGATPSNSIDLFEKAVSNAEHGANVVLSPPTTPPPLPIAGAPPGTPKPETTMVARGAT